MIELKVEEYQNLRGRYVCSVHLEEQNHVVVGFGDNRELSLKELREHLNSHLARLKVERTNYKLITE